MKNVEIHIVGVECEADMPLVFKVSEENGHLYTPYIESLPKSTIVYPHIATIFDCLLIC